MLNYEPEKYISDDEIELLKNTFKYNPGLYKIVRKLFLPTFADIELPIEEIESDIFLQGKQWGMLPADEAKILMVARQEAIQFVMNGLLKLKNIASIEPETEEERAERLKKDSTR